MTVDVTYNNVGVGRSIDRPITIVALILVATVTEAMLLLLPIYVGAIADLLQITDAQIGLLGSADLAGLAIGAASALFWLRKLPWRPLVLSALTLAIVLNITSLYLVDFTELLTIRFIVGMTSGAAYAVALAGLCDTTHEARNTALMVCSQVIFGAVGLYLLPLAENHLRLESVYYYIIAWTGLALLIAVIAFPNNTKEQTFESALSWNSFGMAGIMAVCGTAFYFLTIGVVWAYLERIALEAGLSLSDIGASLSLGYVISLVGSLSAAFIGIRFGKNWPMIIAGSVQLVMLFIFLHITSFNNVLATFFIANAIFQFFWSYIISYQIVIFSDADTSGRFMPLYGTAMHFALAIGPFIGSQLMIDGSYRPALIFGMLILILCYLSFLASVYFHKHKGTNHA